VLRQGGPGAEVYAFGAQGPIPRAVLVPVAAKAPGRLASVSIAENAANEASLDAVFAGDDVNDATVRFELQAGQVFVRTEARRDAAVARGPPGR
jgi:hypothetical protein